MKVLFFICNHYGAYSIRRPERPCIVEPSSEKKRRESMKNCIGAFICVETADGLREVKRCLNDIRKMCREVNLCNVMVAPFAHLSHNLAPPKKAIELIGHIEAQLRKEKYKVLRSAFGFHKNLFLDVKGCDGNIKWRSYAGDAS